MDHRLTKPAHPYTNGPVERMNRTLKEATVKRYHYRTADELNGHLQAFLLAYNHAKRLKTLRRPHAPRIRLCAVAKEPDCLYP